MAGAKAFPVTNKRELQEILERMDSINPMIRLMLEFEARTGLRYSDASNVKFIDVMINGVVKSSFDVIQSKTYKKRISCGIDEKSAKTASKKTVYINDPLKKLIEEAMYFGDGNKLLFQSTHHLAKPDSPITIQYVNRVLKRIAVDMKLPYQLSTHSMRKTFAMMLIDNGASMAVVMKSLGQSSLSSTQHYVDTFLDSSKSYTDQIDF